MVAASASRTAELAEHNVPVPLTSLIGRSRELDGIGEVLRRTRLVTLTGPAVVGKTRLAIEVARRQIGRRPDGVWLVDLTAGPDPAAEVARTLDVGGRSPAAPTESLRGYLADRDLPVVLVDDANRSAEEYERITAHVRGSGPTPPEGCRLVLLGRERAITVWDSAEERDRFLAERLAPAYQAAGVSLDEVTRSQFEVDMLVAGDLAGMAPTPVEAED